MPYLVSVIPLLVCDDSTMARKQVLRALPADWPVSVTEAGNGREAMEAIRRGLGQVVLLDLTMPEMDGYQVLSALRAEGLKAQVIVISGDIQEEAVRRVHELGALAFLKKPFDENQLRQTLSQLGLLTNPARRRWGVVRQRTRSSVFTMRSAKRSTLPSVGRPR